MQVIEILLDILQPVWVQNAVLVKMQEIFQVYLPVFVCIISIEEIAYSVVIHWTIRNRNSSNVVGALVLSHISIDCKAIEDLCEDYLCLLAQLAIDDHWLDFATALRQFDCIEHLTIQLKFFKSKTMIFDDVKVMNFKTNVQGTKLELI